MSLKKVPFILLLMVGLCFSQNKQILYGFSEIPQSLLLNPGGKVDYRGYFGVPMLSHFHVNAGSSGATVYDLFADDGRSFNAKLRILVNTSKPHDFMTVNQQLDLFSGGFAFGSSFEKKEYLSFGLYQELDFISYFPKDYAVLALEGNQSNIGRPFKLDHLNVNAELLTVFHVGYNKKVNEKLTYGIRGKIYNSVLNVNSTKNDGSFLTVRGQNNFYQHIFDLDLEARTSGIASLINDDNSDASEDIKTLRKRILFGGNLGLGLDLGFTYQMTDQWAFDASILDIGFIRHSKDIENYAFKGDLVYEGFDPLFPETGDSQTADDYWNEVEEDFEELFTRDTSTSKYTTWRPMKFNASLNYAFGKKKLKDCDCYAEDGDYLNAIGGQLFVINRPKGPQVALTAYYYRRIFNGLRAKATYTVDSFSFYNMGLGLSAHVGGINLYLMADNFVQYRNVYDAQSVSLQLGLNYIFRSRKDK